MFALVLVEMDIRNDPIEEVYICTPEGARFQNFTSENPPPRCGTCQKFLLNSFCHPCNKRSLDKGKAPVRLVQHGSNATNTPTREVDERDAGIWIMVPNRNQVRRSQRSAMALKQGGKTTVTQQRLLLTRDNTANKFQLLQLDNINGESQTRAGKTTVSV